LRDLNHHLLMAARGSAGHETSPSAGVIDSQSVKTTESAGIRGFDAGKKVNGFKRHIITDAGGLLVGAMVHASDIQDRAAAPPRRRCWLRSVRLSPGCAICSPMVATPSASSKRW
jgi:hypothetical protein